MSIRTCAMEHARRSGQALEEVERARGLPGDRYARVGDEGGDRGDVGAAAELGEGGHGADEGRGRGGGVGEGGEGVAAVVDRAELAGEEDAGVMADQAVGVEGGTDQGVAVALRRVSVDAGDADR